MELKSTTYKKVINPDNQEVEYEVTKTYEEVNTTTETIADKENYKASLQSQIDDIDADIVEMEKATTPPPQTI
jgi:hypothetical protein